jgi:hypothetical protein
MTGDLNRLNKELSALQSRQAELEQHRRQDRRMLAELEARNKRLLAENTAAQQQLKTLARDLEAAEQRAAQRGAAAAGDDAVMLEELERTARKFAEARAALERRLAEADQAWGDTQQQATAGAKTSPEKGEPAPAAAAAAANAARKDADTGHATWHLRLDDGSVYGPVTLGTLRDWAAACRIGPTHEVSDDGVRWQPAGDVAALGMQWLLELPGGERVGPLPAAAVAEMVGDGQVAGAVTAVHQVTGERRTAASLCAEAPPAS